jgi:hypothetical protein
MKKRKQKQKQKQKQTKREKMYSDLVMRNNISMGHENSGPNDGAQTSIIEENANNNI